MKEGIKGNSPTPQEEVKGAENELGGGSSCHHCDHDNEHGHHHHHHDEEGHEAHHHHHHEGEGESRETVVKIIVGGVLLVAAIAVEKTLNLPTWALLLVYLVPYLVVGWETLKEAAEGLSHGDALDENFLMSIATIGALAIGFLPGAATQFPEAVFVMLFFQVGELFEGIAEGQSKRSISHLMDIRPDKATVLRDDMPLEVHAEDVKVGECILIRPGERVPLDGEIVQGDSSLDTVALTGESVPRMVRVGDDVASGCVNLSGVLKVKVGKEFGESTASKILDLVQNASSNKSRSENFITRFARVYTPIVVGLAVLLAILPPVFLGFDQFPTWLYRALTFLIVSCPCALVLSVPLAFFGGIGGASRKGILVKGSNYLEALSKTDTVVFDKTGTLTEGVFEVTAVHPEVMDEIELLHIAAHVERHSNHPIALSLKAAYPNEHDDCSVEDVTEISGEGVKAVVNGREVCVGNSRMMERIGAAWRPCEKTGTIVHVSVDGEYAGHIVISDRVKEDSAQGVEELRKEGVRKIVMLTGDSEEVGKSVALSLGLDEYHCGLLPADKVSHVEQLISRKDPKGTLAFVGDGINDAPVLARADVGIAMGGLGSDAAIDAADVVLMDDKPSKIAQAIRVARKTLGIANMNTWFAIGVKIAVLVLAVFGLAPMWLAVFADVGVTVLCVLNSMRALR